jgi:hypothetical protein
MAHRDLASSIYVRSAPEADIPVASGVVAGGSLIGVVLVFWANSGSILKRLFGG